MNDLPASMLVLFQFQEILGRIHKSYSEYADKLTPTETNMLLHLGTPVRMGKLADLLFCLPSNVTVLVDKFEKLGLLQRQRSEEDRRAIEVALTDKGQELRTQTIAHISKVIEEQSGLDQGDFEKILEVLKQKSIIAGSCGACPSVEG
ncbi:DNA-binding transcriptional regulator, MarR family [Pseudovibrio denitrificans]|uniref:DNA-binding transcriptional regulator, MarR family n=1 Tax=Pseudovibrio denitrificans TaxID=258256 RepID=A0A1I7D064_9HYPH|nr:MarR family winged helix-turn-helix transcriptional regulator [Pseudovibrio denitrificans]SFU05085.1 DNA-binding transcriptional regulator, MarR family [Pseudovibrio denitrificans]